MFLHDSDHTCFHVKNVTVLSKIRFTYLLVFMIKILEHKISILYFYHI